MIRAALVRLRELSPQLDIQPNIKIGANRLGRAWGTLGTTALQRDGLHPCHASPPLRKASEARLESAVAISNADQ
jgi:hypothetical protein